jgi:hypothetical protein
MVVDEEKSKQWGELDSDILGQSAGLCMVHIATIQIHQDRVMVRDNLGFKFQNSSLVDYFLEQDVPFGGFGDERVDLCGGSFEVAGIVEPRLK